ncbi:MAG: hydrogen gas-evolving membrane-bound hydrogenase subunit E [Spirochaetaceae bacterium]|nr:hypothetical protein [Spirochaetaceae bacterium]MDT8299532.1 hydrogen gas-evolving membrane-bound hydrogenase subunit E [Spirochaetaceae bacterium]
MKRRAVLSRILETLIILLVGLFLFLALQGEHEEKTAIRDYLVSHGERETGATNLVTSIYLGYRAYDTLGETLVLLLAVSGVVFFVERES